MRFLRECSGAFADIGITIPLLFVLSTSTDFAFAWLLLGWGSAYAWSSFLFRVPVSVQPLKSMIVMTVALELSVPTVATAGLLFGVILLFIRTSGLLRRIQSLMSAGIVRGIQVLTGIGLAVIAMKLLSASDLIQVTSSQNASPIEIGAVVAGGIVLFAAANIRVFLMIGLVLFGLGFSVFTGPTVTAELFSLNVESLLWFEGYASIQWEYVGVLIVSQLPLTLANAVFAAEQTYRDVGIDAGPTAAQLCTNIGVMDVVLSSFGCFPTCHGSGGIAAHVQAGSTSYVSTLVLGIAYICCAFFVGFGVGDVLLGFPIAIFVVLLLADAIRMVSFAQFLSTRRDWIVLAATVVAGVLSQNVAVGVVSGLVVLGTLSLVEQRKNHG